jgi:hypothetical protein
MDVSAKRSAAEFWRERNRPQRRPARIIAIPSGR